jgi:hypothetical protein
MEPHTTSASDTPDGLSGSLVRANQELLEAWTELHVDSDFYDVERDTIPAWAATKAGT